MKSHKNIGFRLLFLWLLATGAALIWSWINIAITVTPLWSDAFFGVVVIVSLSETN